MGRVVSKLTKPIRNMNVENRAHKTLDKRSEKPVAAPRYPSTVDLLDKFTDENPEYLDEQKKKYDQLVSNMQKLQLDSLDPPAQIKSIPKPLPETRAKYDEPEFGFVEPDSVPEGKALVRQVLKFIAEHQTAPQTYTSWHIAKDYKLNEAHVQQILKYFKTLHILLPDEILKKNPKLINQLAAKESQLSGYSKPTLIKPPPDSSKS